MSGESYLEGEMKWSDDFKIGISAVDSQHKRLFELIRELNDALQEGLKDSDIEKLLVALDQYKTRHFQLEEKYMRECEYPGLTEQENAHAYFTKRFSEIGQQVGETGITPETVQAIQGELAEWVKEHVTGLDKEFGDYYQQHTAG